MTYTLWDTETSNQFGQFENEREALDVVRALVSHYGAHYADELSLGRDSPEGSILPPLSGPDLIARVDEVLSGHRSEDEIEVELMGTRNRHRGVA